MTARGFIQDKLEIKFLILYLAARFRQAPEKLYSEIIDLLLNTPTPEDEEES